MAFIRDNPSRLVPEETLTHSHPTWSSDILYHLPPFTMIHGILFVHFTCMTILSENLSPAVHKNITRHIWTLPHKLPVCTILTTTPLDCTLCKTVYCRWQQTAHLMGLLAAMTASTMWSRTTCLSFSWITNSAGSAGLASSASSQCCIIMFFMYSTPATCCK